MFTVPFDKLFLVDPNKPVYWVNRDHKGTKASLRNEETWDFMHAACITYRARVSAKSRPLGLESLTFMIQNKNI